MCCRFAFRALRVSRALIKLYAYLQTCSYPDNTCSGSRRSFSKTHSLGLPLLRLYPCSPCWPLLLYRRHRRRRRYRRPLRCYFHRRCRPCRRPTPHLRRRARHYFLLLCGRRPQEPAAGRPALTRGPWLARWRADRVVSAARWVQPWRGPDVGGGRCAGWRGRRSTNDLFVLFCWQGFFFYARHTKLLRFFW